MWFRASDCLFSLYETTYDHVVCGPYYIAKWYCESMVCVWISIGKNVYISLKNKVQVLFINFLPSSFSCSNNIGGGTAGEGEHRGGSILLQTPVVFLRLEMHWITGTTPCPWPPVGRSIILPVQIHLTAALTVVAVRFTSKVHLDMLVTLCFYSMLA